MHLFNIILFSPDNIWNSCQGLRVIISFLMIIFRSLPDPYNSSKQAVFCGRAFKTFV